MTATRSHITSFVNGKLVITDNNTGGTLTVTHVMSDHYANNLSESDGNPLVEHANALNESFDNNRLALTLIGPNNFFTIQDDEPFILEGGVELNNVEINNPYLRNVKLADVSLLNSVSVTIFESEIDELHSDEEQEIHIKCCFVDDQYGLDWVINGTRMFFMNKRTNLPA